MASPPNPRIYLADDWSWAITGGSPATAWQNFYVWDGHGGLVAASGYGSGATRGYGFVGESSSGIIGWTIINLDTQVAITSATMGMCWGINQKGVIQNNLAFGYFKEAAAGPTHVYFDTDGTSHIRARNGDGTILGTSTFILPASASDGSGPMYHMEAIVTVSNTVGTVQVWVNDILILDLSAKDTQNGGTGVIGFVEIHATAGRHVAEWFVHDGSARLSSQYRAGYVPTATDGLYSNGTAVGAATGLQAVDDDPATPEAEITTYHVLASALKSSWRSGTFPAAWLTIRDIHPQIVIEKSDGGTNTAKVGLKSGATESYTTSAFGVPDAWVARRLAFRTNPDTGTPLWTRLTGMASEVIVDRES